MWRIILTYVPVGFVIILQFHHQFRSTNRGIPPSHLVLPAQHFTISQSQFSPVHHLTWYSQPSPLYIHAHPDCSPQLKIGFQCVAILCQKIYKTWENDLSPLLCFETGAEGCCPSGVWVAGHVPESNAVCQRLAATRRVRRRASVFVKLEWKNHVARLKI